MNYPFFKRSADLLFAMVAAIVLSPVMVVVMGLIRSVDRQSPLFIQNRPGRGGRLFRCYKLRTMRNGQVTVLGNILRRTALDEVPQLINVLKGEMSLVGPRPLLPEYLDLYTPGHNRRHLVKPGLTGLAQIQKLKNPTWNQRFELDADYAQRIGFWLDLKILLLTVPVIIGSLKGTSSMPVPKFTGIHE